jgi:hypothetical protein
MGTAVRTGDAAPRPTWEVVHALEGVGLGETVHEPGWDGVAVSAEQEFAVACDATGIPRAWAVACGRWLVLLRGFVEDSTRARTQ